MSEPIEVRRLEGDRLTDALDSTTRLDLVRRDVDGATFADHCHLDLARILEMVFDLARDLVR